MRHTRAELASPGDEATSTVTVPLRGYLPALGTIVFEGARVEAGGELDVLDRATSWAASSPTPSKRRSCSTT